MAGRKPATPTIAGMTNWSRPEAKHVSRRRGGDEAGMGLYRRAAGAAEGGSRRGLAALEKEEACQSRGDVLIRPFVAASAPCFETFFAPTIRLPSTRPNSARAAHAT